MLEISAKEESAVRGVMQHPHHFRDYSIKVAGFGGQDVLLLRQSLTEMGMREGLEVSWLPSYGPEMRSGSAHCHVRLSKERIGSPLTSHPDVLIAMNEVSLRKFAHQVVPGGVIIHNRDRLPSDFALPQACVICLPTAEIADKLGSTKVTNTVLMGALLEETECLSPATARGVLETKINKVDLLEIDLQALAAGRNFIDGQVRVGAVSQPDGFAYEALLGETGGSATLARFFVVRHPDQSPGASHDGCT